MKIEYLVKVQKALAFLALSSVELKESLSLYRDPEILRISENLNSLNNKLTARYGLLKKEDNQD